MHEFAQGLTKIDKMVPWRNGHLRLQQLYHRHRVIVRKYSLKNNSMERVNTQYVPKVLAAFS